MECKMSPFHLELHTQQVIVQLKLKECETARISRKAKIQDIEVFIVIDVISGIKEKFITVVSDIVTHIGTSST